jgi:hypothetical protein
MLCKVGIDDFPVSAKQRFFDFEPPPVGTSLTSVYNLEPIGCTVI